MEKKVVSLKFANTFNGTLYAPNGTALIGAESGTLAPYDMLFGALAGCLYSTFLDVAVKKRINFSHVDLVVSGEKRSQIPMTLEWVHIKAVIHDAEKELGLTQAFDLATQYCSIYETISKVAKMTYEVDFAYDGKMKDEL